MGTAFTTAVGNPPNIATDHAGWQKWYADLLAFRISECPLARTTTYYFAQNGNDTTGNGSQATPWLTLAKAQAQITAAGSNADLRLRFRRGDAWEETTGLTLNKSNITVDAYGTGNKPLFNLFTRKYTSTGWTVATGDRYTRAETNDIAWVREVSDRLGVVYTRVSSTALVESTPFSFYWVSNVLHINAGAGINPNSKNLESVISNSSDGIAISGNGCRIEGIRGDGWGCHRTTTATQAQPLTCAASGTNSCLAVDCEGYYSGSHVIAHTQGGSSGGIFTLIRCKAGYGKYNGASGETIFNFFAASGGHEIVTQDCECVYGTLPSSDWYSAGATTRRGNGFYGHTTTGNANLIASNGSIIRNNAYGAGSPSAYSNIPTATVIDDVRCFVVNEIFEGGDGTSEGYNPAPANQIRYGCRHYFKPWNLSSTALTSSGVELKGWLINCLIDVDWIYQSSNGPRGIYNSGGFSGKSPGHMWHCLIRFRTVRAGTQAIIDRQMYLQSSTPSNRTDAHLYNCIIVHTGTGTANLGVGNDAQNLNGNAYYGLSGSTFGYGYSNDLAKVDLVDPIEINMMPNAASAVYHLGVTTLNLSHDIDGERRTVATPDIGAKTSYAGLIAPDVINVRKGTVYDGTNKTGTLALGNRSRIIEAVSA